MAEWRILRGWSEDELAVRLDALASAGRNFDDPPERLRELTGWSAYVSEGIIGQEPPGTPVAGGAFERARQAVRDYAFSDPGIVRAVFDRSAPVEGRRMLLEIRVLGLRYLCGVVVGAVRDEADAERIVYGYRYDTLRGHLERGAEWFLLTKKRATGEIHFQISAHWGPGDFPNWWTRLGFALLVRRYQRRWHRQARARLIRVVETGRIDIRPVVDTAPIREGGLS